MLKFKDPFFILSNPRSGSSLLRIICDSNQNLCVPPECGFLEWWYDKYRDWNSNDINNGERINSFCEDLASSKKFETWGFDMLKLKSNILENKPTTYAQLVGLVYVTYAEIKNKSNVKWGDKNNYYITKLSLLYKLYPNAKYIHLIRDGRDVATSYMELKNIKSDSKYFPQLPTEINEIATEWLLNNNIIYTHCSALDKDQYLLLKYEDVLRDTENVCKKVCDFLGVEYDSNMLVYYLGASKEPKATIDWKVKTSQKPDTLNINKYEKLLSHQQINAFNNIAGSMLDKYGYER